MVGYLTLPYRTILPQVLTDQHTFTYLPKHMPYPILTYPILPLPHSHPTPTKRILNTLTKHTPTPPYPIQL